MAFYKKTILFSLVALIFTSSFAVELSYEDIQSLIKQEQFNKALKLVEKQLSLHQADIKLRFIKGLILTRLNRYEDAEKVFIQLTEQKPELPEPYNNLAVVYAAQGKYKEAIQALKNAINTHPSYATAHENLGDIYTRMASRAYNQAFDLDNNNTVKKKLSLMNELVFKPIELQQKTVADKAPGSKSTPVSRKALTKAGKETPSMVRPINGEGKGADFPGNESAVEKALNRWAKAWGEQDVGRYIASYSPEFVQNEPNRAEWEAQRRQRLLTPGYINVILSDVKINMYNSRLAEITFTQSYQSDTYSDKVRKIVSMHNMEGDWLIIKEKTQ